jgi:hypothetical protein
MADLDIHCAFEITGLVHPLATVLRTFLRSKSMTVRNSKGAEHSLRIFLLIKTKNKMMSNCKSMNKEALISFKELSKDGA